MDFGKPGLWRKGKDHFNVLPVGHCDSAAATCTYVYINTTDGLYTFNADTMQQVARVFWANHGGGLSAPVVGPFGHVYAIASNNLFVFEAPLFPTISGCRGPNQNPYQN